jgi:hypothetical protein
LVNTYDRADIAWFKRAVRRVAKISILLRQLHFVPDRKPGTVILDQGVAVFAWAAIGRTTHTVAAPALALVLLFAAIPDFGRT